MKNNAKKSFKKGLGSLLTESAPKDTQFNKTERPVTSKDNMGAYSYFVGDEEYVRKTYMMKKTLSYKLVKLAHAERNKIQNVLEEILEAYLFDYENKNGPLPEIPFKKQRKPHH